MASRLSFLKTEAALAEAGAFADQFLSPETRSGGSSAAAVRHDHYHWGSGSGYYPQPVYCGASKKNSESEKKDHSWIAIPAFLASLCTLYFLGQNHAEWSQATNGMEKLQDRKIEVQVEISRSHPALKGSMHSVFQKEMKMLDSLRGNAATGFTLKVIFATSCVVFGTGALTAASPFLAIGGVSAFVTTGAMLYRAGFSSMDSAMKEDARDLNIAVQQASFVLNELRA